MIKIIDFLRKLDKYTIISIAVTVGFLACTVFVFTDSFQRTIDSFVNIGTSSAYFFTIGLQLMLDKSE